LLGLGGREPFLDEVGVPIVKPRQIVLCSALCHPSWIGGESLDLIGGQEGEVGEPDFAGDSIGLRARRAGRRNEIGSERGDSAPDCRVEIVSLQHHAANTGNDGQRGSTLDAEERGRQNQEG
jgi:hypothetical protein